MKKSLLMFIIIIISGCGSSTDFTNNNRYVYFETDLSDPSDDLFHVTVYPPKLSDENNIYNFVSTAPGTYQNLNIGRFVKSFHAFDKNNNELNVKNISTNEWEFESPEEVYKIIYTVEDSYDTEINDDLIMPMSGTGIEDKYILLNTFGVFGYFEGLQSFPIKLKIDYPDNWIAATTMNLIGDYYYSGNFDELADSPVLLGELTHASKNVSGIDVDVYVYSDVDFITAESVLKKVDNVLNAAGKFLSYPLVNKYKFLLTFYDNERAARNRFITYGALEHSYSSFYIIPANQKAFNTLDGFMAHEFFHIVTPLNLHSEVIETYNFEKPVPSQHLWLYEGITEWVAHTMQLRGNLIDLPTYLSRIQQKLNTSQNFYDDNYPIAQLSSEAYTPKGGREYINIYQKGAVIAALLDLRLLDLSNGERGLREVILDLTTKYGKSKPFKENEFFKIFVDNTYPEIEEFINKYIKDAQPLPLEEYFKKVGVKYIYKKPSDQRKSNPGIFAFPNQQGELRITSFNKDYNGNGLEVGDIILKVDGKEITSQNVREIFTEYSSKDPGTKVEYLIRRNDEEISVEGELYKNNAYNNFEIMDGASPRQLILRNAWTQNRPV